MNILFRKAEVSDKDKVLRLLSSRQDESNLLYGGSKNIVFENGETIFESMLENKNINIVVGEIEGEIVAHLTIYVIPRIRSGGFVGLIEDVVIAKNYRQKGVGRNLMEFSVRMCRDLNINTIKLGIRMNNPDVEMFYKKLGFEHYENLLQLSIK